MTEKRNGGKQIKKKEALGTIEEQRNKPLYKKKYSVASSSQLSACPCKVGC
jgi:hypothetical protein